MRILKILITINFLFANDYFISFQYKIKNYRVEFFNFNCAKALSVKNSKKVFLFSFPCDNENIQNCCLLNENKIVDFLLKKSVVISSEDELRSNSLQTSSKLTYLPQRFDIIIKDGIAYFYQKGE